MAPRNLVAYAVGGERLSSSGSLAKLTASRRALSRGQPVVVAQRRCSSSVKKRAHCALRSALHQTAISAIPTARQQVVIQLGSSRSTIQLQLNARSSPITAVQRRIFNPLSQLFVVAEGITNCEPEKAGIGVNKARREPPMTPMSVN